MLLRILTALLILLSFASELVLDSSTPFVRAYAPIASDVGNDFVSPSVQAHAVLPVLLVAFVNYPEVLEFRTESLSPYFGPALAQLHRPPILSLRIAA